MGVRKRMRKLGEGGGGESLCEEDKRLCVRGGVRV